MKIFNKVVLSLAIAAVMPSYTVAAENYPAGPVTLIVPYGPGGSTDLLARALGSSLGKVLGQTVVIENKPGANGTMGVLQLMRAKPDGYTLSLVPLGVFRQPYLQQGGTAYDPLKDITYVSRVAGYDTIVSVKSDSKWDSLKSLLQDAQAKPTEYSYSTPGLYTSNHIAMSELLRMNEAPITHVPYKGDSDAISALLGGHVDVVVSTATILPFVQSGQVRALATMSPERSADLPGVPTLKELGYDVVSISPLGIGGPAGMSQELTEKLDNAIETALADPEFVNSARKIGLLINYQDRNEYRKYAEFTSVSEKNIIERLASEIEK